MPDYKEKIDRMKLFVIAKEKCVLSADSFVCSILLWLINFSISQEKYAT
jgi:hypothetical protein